MREEEVKLGILSINQRELLNQVGIVDQNSILSQEKRLQILSAVERAKLSHFQKHYLLLLIQSKVLNIAYSIVSEMDFQGIEETFKRKVLYMLGNNGAIETEFQRLVLLRATKIATSYWERSYGSLIDKIRIRVLEMIEPGSSGLHFYHPTIKEYERIINRTDGRYTGKEEFIKAVESALTEMAKNRPQSLGFGLVEKLKSDLGDLLLVLDENVSQSRKIQELANLWTKMKTENMLETFGIDQETVKKILQITEWTE